MLLIAINLTKVALDGDGGREEGRREVCMLLGHSWCERHAAFEYVCFAHVLHPTRAMHAQQIWLACQESVSKHARMYIFAEQLPASVHFQHVDHSAHGEDAPPNIRTPQQIEQLIYAQWLMPCSISAPCRIANKCVGTAISRTLQPSFASQWSSSASCGQANRKLGRGRIGAYSRIQQRHSNRTCTGTP